MSKHQVHHSTHHDSSSNHNSKAKDASNDKSKVNMPVLSIVALIAIILIVMMTVSLKSKLSEPQNTIANRDVSGQALKVITIQESLCKIIVGRTSIYDDTTLAVTLAAQETTYYLGYSVNVLYINDEGCTVNVNGNSEYLAIGQIQRLGNLYVTIKGVVN